MFVLRNSRVVEEKEVTELGLLIVLQPTFPKAPIYGLSQKGYVSGTPAAYKPKGVWENPEKRNWKKVAVWQP